MQYVFRKPGPLEVRRDIQLPQGEKSLRNIGDYCGTVATRSLLETWSTLQEEVPEIQDGLPRLIKPLSVVMLHAPEVATILANTSLSDKKQSPKPRRKHARAVIDSIQEMFAYTYDAIHTLRPENVTGVETAAHENGVRMYVTFDHESQNWRGELTEHADVTSSLGDERRVLDRLVHSHYLRTGNNSTLDGRHTFGMPFAEIPYEYANQTFERKIATVDENGVEGTKVEQHAILDVLTGAVSVALAEEKIRSQSGSQETGIFILNPPYLSHKVQPAYELPKPSDPA